LRPLGSVVTARWSRLVPTPEDVSSIAEASLVTDVSTFVERWRSALRDVSRPRPTTTFACRSFAKPWSVNVKA
jgi:hypothetical protein